MSQTYCVDAQIADSACSATAYLGGAKANIGTIGVSAHVPREHCTAAQLPHNHVHSIAEWALTDGRDAGTYIPNIKLELCNMFLASTLVLTSMTHLQA